MVALLLVGLVGVELLALELVVVVGLLLVEVDVVGVLVVDDGLELLELLELVVLAGRQSRAASSPTVAAPWPRFWTSVVFTVEGRSAT